MLELITATLIAMGFNVSCTHYTMNDNNASKIKLNIVYVELGGDIVFDKFVTVDPKVVDDVVICDQDEPNEKE